MAIRFMFAYPNSFSMSDYRKTIEISNTDFRFQEATTSFGTKASKTENAPLRSLIPNRRRTTGPTRVNRPRSTSRTRSKKGNLLSIS